MVLERVWWWRGLENVPEVVVPWDTLEDDVNGRETVRVWEELAAGGWEVWGWEGVKVWVEVLLEVVLEDEWDGIWWCCANWCCCWRAAADTKVDPRVELVLGTTLEFSTLLAGTILLKRNKWN